MVNIFDNDAESRAWNCQGRGRQQMYYLSDLRQHRAIPPSREGYADHQGVWPEAVWNEDAREKYLEPLENDGDSAYLTMLQGSKASQREWWLYNGFRYRGSKYQCGDASASFITLCYYNVGNITVTPYSRI